MILLLEILIATILLILLGISVYYNIRFGIIILRIQDVIEDGLDELDQRYAVFGKILEKPVFFDSVEIRQVIQEIRESQALLLKIANSLASFGNSDQNEKVRQQEIKKE
jgi:cyclophilin family peptidyl-prolyl cis-trans isomerase